jgi:hypothetical protein
VASHQDRIDAIKSAAQQFIDSGHFDVDSILAKQVSCLYNKKFPYAVYIFMCACVSVVFV